MPRFNFTNITLQSRADITDVMGNFNELETNGVSQNDLITAISDLHDYIADAILQDAMNKNPVGTIISSTNSANPATYMGFGTWVAWGSGRVPVGVNENDTDFNAAEKTIGSKTITLTEAQLPSHTHTYDKANGTTGAASGNTGSTTLTINQIPSHTHKFNSNGNAVWQQIEGYGNVNTSSTTGANRANIGGTQTVAAGGSQGHTHSLNNHTHSVWATSTNTGAKGSGQAISNLQPSIPCYMWRRTA